MSTTALVQKTHTSIETDNCGRRGFAVHEDYLFVGTTNEVLQFVIGGAPDASNELLVNAKLEVLDVAPGDAGSNDVFVLTTYTPAVRAARGFAPDVYPLFVSLFVTQKPDSAVELFSQPLPVHSGTSAAFAYDANTFLVAHGGLDSTLAILYKRIINGKKVTFQELNRVRLAQLPEVLNVSLCGGVALLWNADGFLTWTLNTNAVSELVRVADFSAAAQTQGNKIVTASTTGVLQVFLDGAVIQTLNIDLDKSKSLHADAKRVLPDDGPSRVGDEIATIEAAVAAANAAAATSDDDDDESSEEDTIFVNSIDSSDDETESDDTDIDVDVASEASAASAASASASDAADVSGPDVFKDVINLTFRNGALFVHTYSDDLLLYVYE